MEKTKIIIVRHGESLGNAKRIMLGHTNLDLSEHGYKQARATAEFLKNEKIDHVYSSDLLRAYNTALPHAEMRGLPVCCDKGLRELAIGDWEGHSVEDIKERYGDMFEKEWHRKFGEFCFPGGEAVMDGGNRFLRTVTKIATRHRGKTVLIAAHAAVIRAFWAIISGVDPRDIVDKVPFPSNASFSVASFDGDAITPIEYSCDEHLIEVGITYVKV